MSHQNQTIFVVDDDELLSSMLSDYLSEHNPAIEIKTFATGEDCLASLDEQPNIVILDFHLNTKVKAAADGLDILKQIKDRYRSLPVIMLSSQNSYSKAAQTIGEGAVHYVIKGEDSFDEIQGLVKANM